MEEVKPQTGPRVRTAASSKKKYGWLSRLRSYLFIDPLIFLLTGIFGLTSVPFSLFGDKERILHRFAQVWAKLTMKATLCSFRVIGLDKIDTSKNYIYAVNHASALDIPILYAYLPFQFRILFKSELLSYPIVGWHLKRSGQICINQQEPARSVGQIRSALKSLKGGIPLVIFPEGGRTPDGEIKSFMQGAFFLAIRAQVDVVPVALVDTFDLLPMNTYHVKCQPLEMRVGNPISTSGLKLHDLESLSSKVQKALEDLYYEESTPNSEPEKILRSGAEILDQVLKPHGFRFKLRGAGKGSGGNFAWGEFRRFSGKRRIELHYRYNLGQVTYHIEDASLSHEDYMRSLGVHGKNSYPDFPKNPIESFRSLARDLETYCTDFLSGDGKQFLQFASDLRENPKKFSGLI